MQPLKIQLLQALPEQLQNNTWTFAKSSSGDTLEVRSSDKPTIQSRQEHWATLRGRPPVVLTGSPEECRALVGVASQEDLQRLNPNREKRLLVFIPYAMLQFLRFLENYNFYYVENVGIYVWTDKPTIFDDAQNAIATKNGAWVHFRSEMRGIVSVTRVIDTPSMVMADRVVSVSFDDPSIQFNSFMRGRYSPLNPTDVLPPNLEIRYKTDSVGKGGIRFYKNDDGDISVPSLRHEVSWTY